MADRYQSVPREATVQRRDQLACYSRTRLKQLILKYARRGTRVSIGERQAARHCGETLNFVLANHSTCGTSMNCTSS